MKFLKFLLLIALLLASAFFALENVFPNEKSGDSRIGLERTECWFDKTMWNIFTRCYYMNVPEDHQEPSGRIIRFPVVYFKTKDVFSKKSPVLHLGGGGPGGPMYLDYSEGVEFIKLEHDDFSLKKSRDLIVIDVRGTGLAQPALACQRYVKRQPTLLNQDLSFVEEWQQNEPALLQCIDDFKRAGISLAQYNSSSIAQDIDLLSNSLKKSKLVLFGVSYGSVYAQVIAKQYPERIESLILDSAAFPQISLDENYLNRALAPYKALYNHCSIAQTCSEPASATKDRIWSIYKSLERYPIRITLENYNTGEPLAAVLNGERFIASLVNASYSMDIFYDLSAIMSELEKGKTVAIKPYFETHASFLLDPQWGDISAQAHYCYETKPFIDHRELREDIDRLPSGYIQDSAEFFFNANEFCEAMEISAANPSFEHETPINIPTLFLHGEHDPITPLSDVMTERKLFTNNQLLTYPTSHSVLTATTCAEKSAGKFVEKPSTTDLSC